MCYTDTQINKIPVTQVIETKNTSYIDTRYKPIYKPPASWSPSISSKAFVYLLVGAADAGPTAMGGTDSSSNNCFSLGEDEKHGLLPVSLLHPRHHNNFSFLECGNSLIATKCIPAKYLYP